MKTLPELAKSGLATLSLAVALISVPCVSLSQTAGENLLQNGGAELGGVSGWTKFAGTASTSLEGANAFVLNGGNDSDSTAFSEDLIPVDPDARYELSGFFMSEEGMANVHLGFDCYNAARQRITSEQVAPVPGTETELLEDVRKGDMVVKIKDGSAWVFEEALTPKYGVVAFDVDASGAYSDLPNRKLSKTGINAIRQVDGQWEVELANPMGADYPAGTTVRQQKTSGAFRWVIIKGVGAKWIELRAEISGVSTAGPEQGKFWPGTRFVKVAILNLNNEKFQSPKVLVDDVTFRRAD